MTPDERTDEPEDDDRGQLFFITEKRTNQGRNLAVMSTSEIEDEPARQLVAGSFHSREEAEAALRQGLADGSWSA